MIKLVITDVDGTLLQEGTSNLNPEYFTVIRELQKKGIRFVAASGRGYDSLANAFAPIKDEITLMAENGGYIVKHGEDLYTGAFNEEQMQAAFAYMRSANEVFHFASTTKGAIADMRNDEFVSYMEKGYGIKLRYTQDVTNMELPVLKAAVYCNRDAQHEAEKAKEILADQHLNIMATGDHWVDMVPGDVSKGHGLNILQQLWGITPEETMAFGDNDNDIPMLQEAGRSYAVADARETVKKAADQVIGSWKDDAVLQVLKTLI